MRPVAETLDVETYKKYLDEKLAEELKEYLKSNCIEELADLVEVIYALLNYKGVSVIEDIRKKTAAKRGTFDRRLLLKEAVEE